MNQASLTWLVVIVLTLSGLGVWVTQTRPRADAIRSAMRELPPLPSEVIRSEVLSVLNARMMNGRLPVTPSSPVPARGNPFND